MNRFSRLIIFSYILLSANANAEPDQVNQNITEKSTGIGINNGTIIINTYSENKTESAGKNKNPGDIFVDELKDGGQSPEMVVIPAGSFIMGSPNDESPNGDIRDRQNDEGPQHKVVIAKPFAIGKYEVTVGDFKRFVAGSWKQADGIWNEIDKGNDGCYFIRFGREMDKNANWDKPRFDQDDQHPVVCISWNDAQAFVDWLSKQTGKLYRLPSEAEWEYAARAGSTSIYPWGSDLENVCRYANMAQTTSIGISSFECKGNDEFTSPVGKYLENAFGVKDMIGNVSEWVEDISHDNYVGAPNDGSAWNSGEDNYKHIIRGGSWMDQPRMDGRSANRDRIEQNASYNLLGFRVARDL